MNVFRLFTIIFTTIRFGLDEIVVRSFAPRGFARFWLALMFWRPLFRPRAVRLRAALESLGPIFVKFGQVLSTRQDILPADVAAELSALQDRVAPQPFPEIRAAIQASYDVPVEEVFESLDEAPLGSASVAQVHSGRLAGGEVVAVKVLRPGIHHQIARDLALMRSFASLIEWAVGGLRRLRLTEIVAEFHSTLSQETDLLSEAASCNQIGRNFADEKRYRVPKVVWAHCTREVMVMELLEGTPVDQADDLKKANVDLEALALTGIEVFFTQVFRDSFFHADMHPGNLLVDGEGRLVALDFGIMGTLTDFDKEYIGANFLAFFNRDYRKVAVMHIEAGWIPADTSVPQFEAAIRAVCEPIFARPVIEISFARLLLQLLNVARRFSVNVQPQLMLLQKTLLNIEGIGRQLAPHLDLWKGAKPILEEWARERSSPKRFASMVTDSAPAIASILPEIPVALRYALRRARSDEPRLEREVERLRSATRSLWLALAVTAGAVLLLWLG